MGRTVISDSPFATSKQDATQVHAELNYSNWFELVLF